MQELIEKTDLAVNPDCTVDAAELPEPIAFPTLSTILALGGASSIAAESTGGGGFAGLGLKAIHRIKDAGTQSGVYLLLGIDGEQPAKAQEFLSGVKLCVWPVGQLVPAAVEHPVAVSPVGGVGEFGLGLDSGAHWFLIEPPGAPPIVFPLAMLTGRVTMLVVETDATLKLRVFQYLPSLTPDESFDPRVLRRLEMMQRIQLSEWLSSGYQTARELLDGEWGDPIAGCLGAYLLLRLGKARELGPVVDRLTSEFPQLSDGHVLRAELEASCARSEGAKALSDGARKAICDALEAGVPIFGEGISRLLDGVQGFQIDHKNTRLVSTVAERYMHGSLWSAWIPETVRVGELLVP
jgi:hypothetical protein